ncbi:hypothetical protein A2115_00810 [Candidatus Woesebacteria bacterium GWA1_41_8]|uniref:Ribonuclease n=1 Tax=Candidatus Woesebacteria bacterium GWA1_41_8 TaxID=1802471 RepID=A0A1F7WI93_9BACT|nr:MAG: hypothetical protein A2115_00810 [Candidatus Woesebacteria bacterium GWA1_41_8]
MGVDFSFEKPLWNKGFGAVAGVDEVGRGCFAGPVVAGCVVFARNSKFRFTNKEIRIDDSKKLTPRQRLRADGWIRQNAASWGIGEAPVSLINRLGMGKATKVAFRRAIAAAQKKLTINYLLIDAFYIPWVKGLRRKNQKAIINGDEKSFTIAAASIIAKVYRDGLMENLSKNKRFKIYGWENNKGYGTKKHRQAIKKYGLTRYHRKAFVKNFVSSKPSF